MEVKPGYKQTDVGVIPDEWDVAPLGKEVERLDAGVSVNSVDDELHSHAHEESVLKTSAILGGRFLPQESKKIVPRDIGRAKLNPRFDTIIISRMNTPDLVGECGYVFADFPYLFLPDRLWMSRNRPGSKVNVRWLNYLLSSWPYKTRIKELATGTSGSMKNIAKDSLLAMPIAYPTSPEQCAIAETLSDVDGLLGGLDRLIVKKRDIKQAAIQQLLTGRTRLPGFHGEWEVVSMREVLAQSATYGIVTAGKFVQNGVKMLRGGDIIEGRIDTDLPMVSREKAAEYVRTILVRNDVVIALVGYPGASAKIPDELIGANISRAVGLLRLNSKVSADFLVCFLNSPVGRRMVLAPSAGSAQQVVNLAALNKLQFTIPPVTEQTAIAEVLTEMDAELAALGQRREKVRALKKAMMQELLTGRIRLA